MSGHKVGMMGCMLTLLLAFVSFASTGISADVISAKMPVLTVCGERGTLNRLPFRYERANSHEPLRIDISDDTPMGAER